MGAVRNLALAILAISGLTFVALFGRLPIFRYAENIPFGLDVVDKRRH